MFKYIDYIDLINPIKIKNRKEIEKKFKELSQIAKQKKIIIIINNKEFKIK